MKIIIMIILFFSHVSIYGQNVFPFHKNKKWYFVSKELKRIDNRRYDSIIPTALNFYIVSKKNKYALVNSNGFKLTDYLFDRIHYNGDINKFIAHSVKNIFQIDLSGKIEPDSRKGICRGDHSSISKFFTYQKENKIGLIIVRKSGENYYYDSIPAIYDAFIETYNSMAYVKVKDLWGVINQIGEYIIIPTFDEIIEDFNEDTYSIFGAIVKKNGLVGWINKDGKLIILTKYRSLTPFRNGYSFVYTTDNRSGYILENGTELFD